MAELKVDTEKLKEIGNTIIDDCKDLTDIFDSFYAMLLSVQEDSWTGESANAFCRNVSAQRSQYNNYFVKLNRFGEFFVKTANTYANYTEIYKVKK